MQTLEGNSPDWIQIGDAIQNSRKPIRQIARENGLSDTALHKAMKRHGWKRPEKGQPLRKPARNLDCKPSSTQSEAAAKAVSSVGVKELTKRGRGIILSLMDELEFLNANAETLVEIVQTYVNGEKDDRTRFKLLKVLDHETRSKTANYLATALAKLKDAAPGKKEQAKIDAETAGQGTQWGDDLDFEAKFN